jgi:hypothetical protein
MDAWVFLELILYFSVPPLTSERGFVRQGIAGSLASFVKSCTELQTDALLHLELMFVLAVPLLNARSLIAAETCGGKDSTEYFASFTPRPDRTSPLARKYLTPLKSRAPTLSAPSTFSSKICTAGGSSCRTS